MPPSGDGPLGSRPPEKHLGLGRMLMLPPRPPSVKASTGSKRKAVESASQSVSSSSTPLVSVPSVDASQTAGSGIGGGSGGIGGSGTQGEIGIGGGSGTQGQDDQNVIVIDDEANIEPAGKRTTRCTSDVWNFFSKEIKIVEVNGKHYQQLWGHCKFPNCKQKYRAGRNHGTTGFRNHLKSSHSIGKGQQQLIVGKDHGKDISIIEPYRMKKKEMQKK